MAEIIKNTTQLNAKVWNDRIYINAKMGVLGNDIYINLDDLTVYLKATNRKVVYGWKVTKSGSIVTIESQSSHDLIEVRCD
jgi:pantothenate kinase-related protein Tda10